MSRLLLQRRETISFLTHAQGIVVIAWYGNVHFKQRAVIELRVAEKKSVTNVRKRLKICTVSVLLMKARPTTSLSSPISGTQKDQEELNVAR
jgi:hypothetical protein